jgi:hypothetical protein
LLDRGETVAPCPRIATSTSLHPPRAGCELTKVGGWQVEHGAPELERESRRPNSALSNTRGSALGVGVDRSQHCRTGARAVVVAHPALDVVERPHATQASISRSLPPPLQSDSSNPNVAHCRWYAGNGR